MITSKKVKRTRRTIF
jgi:hypothetical protein